LQGNFSVIVVSIRRTNLRCVSNCTRKLGKLALMTAAVALLVPAAVAGAAGQASGPLPLEVGLRHGPERIEDAEPPKALSGAYYSYRFQSDRVPEATFTASAADLPPGLSLAEDGLLSGTPTTPGHYFFVVFASNGETEGTEQQVNMDVVAPPSASVEPANVYAPTRAVLTGWVNPGNLPTDAWFEYWPVGGAAHVQTQVLGIPPGTKPVEVGAKLDGLTTGVEYEFRLGASNELSSGPVHSETLRMKPELPPPEAGRTFNVEPVGGRVRTKCVGERSFKRLKHPRQVTLNCRIDTENGTVSVTASKGSSGQTQSAHFWGGIFSVFQKAGDNRQAVLRLTGKRRCERRLRRAHRPGRRAEPSRAFRRRRKGGRRLWGSGKGKYRTVGKHGAATVRGTIWLVADRCNGSTVFKVRRGTVWVTDFIKHAKVVLKAGQSYIAKADFDHVP
jgi:Putative Ig domain